MDQVAAVLFSTGTPGLVYAGVGKKGASGGLLVSQDGGRTWSLRSSVPQFSGGDNEGVNGIPHTHPRSTGALLAEDPAGGYLYAATFAQGRPFTEEEDLPKATPVAVVSHRFWMRYRGGRAGSGTQFSDGAGPTRSGRCCPVMPMFA